MKLLFIGLTINRNWAAPENGFGFEQIKISLDQRSCLFPPKSKFQTKSVN
jgi:hypothetical protein